MGIDVSPVVQLICIFCVMVIGVLGAESLAGTFTFQNGGFIFIQIAFL